MKLIFQAAQQVQDFFDSQEWRFCFIGGVALQRWGRPRLTNDIDLTLLTGFGAEDVFIDPILEKFDSRIDDAKNFALQNRILLLQLNNIGIDISLGGLFFEESAVDRAVEYQFLPDVRLRICTAEDLIVFKAFADRLQDWADVQNIITIQDVLDWKHIYEQLAPLAELKEAPEILDKLENLKNQK